MRKKFIVYLLIPIIAIVCWFKILPFDFAHSASNDPQLIHILDRLTFGQTQGSIDLVKSQGIKNYIASQLAYQSIKESPELSTKLREFSTFKETPAAIYREYERLNFKENKQDKKETVIAREYRNKMRDQAIEAHLVRAIASKKQLQEVLTNFWFNHFNVFVRKNRMTQMWIGNYEEQAIRPYTMGKFRDLLGAVARHPAMLEYLDNWRNTDPNSPEAKGQFKGINENYARELLELHTLGVDGGYGQEDVVNLAHILTGWGVSPNGKQGDGTGFYFNPKRHDFSDKVLLGQTIKGSGADEVEQALDLLARHPSTARHLSYKLAQYFVNDEPPVSLVKNLAQKFSQTDGNLKAVLETLFQSPEFLNSQFYDSKFKTPYEYVVSLVRAVGINNVNIRQVSGTIAQMGMPIFGCSTPDGYKNTREAWLSPDAMMRRVSLATAFSRGSFNQKQAVNANQLSQTLGDNFSPHTQSVLNSSPPNLQASLMLGSPEMMNR